MLGEGRHNPIKTLLIDNLTLHLCHHLLTRFPEHLSGLPPPLESVAHIFEVAEVDVFVDDVVETGYEIGPGSLF